MPDGAIAHHGLEACAETLLASARTRVGHDDFGDGWQEGFARLLPAIDRIGLSPDLVEASAHRMGVFLDARLHAARGWAERPGCLAEPIERPIIIAGLVRSGTTALHKLMSIDRQFQGTEHWLTLAPMARPPREEWPHINAYRTLAGFLDVQIRQSPELKSDHGMAVGEVEESLFILAQNFSSNMFASMWDVPEYDGWVRARDPSPDYRYLADVLRLIGHGDRRTWLLKNPGDLFAMDAVLTTFPNARIIQTHRDPVEAIPSVSNLIWSARRMVMGPQASAEAVGRRECALWAQAVALAFAARSKAPTQFVDVEFDNFLSDPLNVVQHIYDQFGLILSASTEAAMRAWLAANPRKLMDVHRFTPETFGLTVEQIKAEFASYRERRGYV